MPRWNPTAVIRHALMAAALNTLIAAAITAVLGESFAVNLLYSQLIGLSIWVLIDGGRWLLRPATGWPGVPGMAALVVIGVLAGYAIGSTLGNVALGRTALHGLERFPRATLGFVLMSLAAGGILAYIFTSREMLARARLAQEESQRQASEARLRLLETQLEPHMLFNTLANLRALIGVDPARAQAMLDHLNAYLRATLAGSRATTHALASEFERLDDYLQLMAVRMGPRLRRTLDLPASLRDQPVPTLLLQPLVENAIRHGLEPRVEGGEVIVRARAQDAQLVLEVSDTGVGFDPAPPPATHDGHGFGLAQVRERLATAYGAAGVLQIESRTTGGTTVRVALPLTAPRSAAPGSRP